MVTGGAGFIGSALVRHLIAETDSHVLTIDKLTYSGRKENLGQALGDPRHRFEKTDITDKPAMTALFTDFAPDIVFHLAAESHVDRSIDSPDAFIETNIIGTYNLIECARQYLANGQEEKAKAFRFVHISTDEVFGDLGETGKFSENSPYTPNSPYSASKAGSDHLVRAWHHTYGLPAIITNCTNNYGPYQYPEKLLPLMILNALDGKPLPVYGDGQQIRDWLYVDDHIHGLLLAAERGQPGETYCIGGDSERSNIDVVNSICDILDELRPDAPSKPHRSLIKFVDDRPGHDRRYAMDSTKITKELNWKPMTPFDDGLRRTIEWMLDNLDWCASIAEGNDARARRGTVDGKNDE